ASAGSLVMRGWLRDDAGESLVDEAFRIVVVLVALIVALVPSVTSSPGSWRGAERGLGRDFDRHVEDREQQGTRLRARTAHAPARIDRRSPGRLREPDRLRSADEQVVLDGRREDQAVGRVELPVELHAER